MKSSTNCSNPKEMVRFEKHWEEIQSKIGIDLEASAREQKAFLRARGLNSVSDLLRLCLVFGTQDWSYEQMALWATLQEAGDLSGVAVRQRLQNAESWLQEIVSAILRQRGGEFSQFDGWSICLQDATTVSRPGSQGTDARLHLNMDLARLCVRGVELTDASVGETFAHFEIQPNEIRIGDRGYAFAKSMGPVLKKGYLVVRANWQNLPMFDANGRRFDVIAWLRTLDGPGETTVQVYTPEGCFSVRLLAVPLSPKAAEAARRRARQAAQKKHHQVSDNTLLAAGFLLLVTNLPVDIWSLELVCWLYRLRWQIELQFKRYKSILHLDQLRATDPQMIRVCLLCKILAILLLDQLMLQVRLQQPDWFTNTERPISLWRLTQYLWTGLRDLICGSISIARLLECLPRLRRFLSDAPRRRQKQLAWALAVLDQPDPSFSFFGC
jgi:hypothetical protein